MFLRTPSMSLWKLAGQPSRPIGDAIQWNWPLPGIVKAVSCCDLSSNCICQNPEVRSRVEKNGWVCSPDIANALCDFFHWIFVNVRVVVKFTKVLNHSQTLALFFWYAKDGWVIKRIGEFDNPEFQPFFQRLFNEILMCLWYLKLFPVNWIIVFEMNFVLKVFCKT